MTAFLPAVYPSRYPFGPRGSHTGGVGVTAAIVEPETMQVVSAVLALVAAALALVVVAARLLAGRVAWAAACSERVARHRTPITLALAGTAMVCSLYYSEVAHYVP